MALAIGVSLFGCGTDVHVPTAAAQTTCVDQAVHAGLGVDARDPREVWATDYDPRRRSPTATSGQFVFDAARPSVLVEPSARS